VLVVSRPAAPTLTAFLVDLAVAFSYTDVISGR